MFLKRTTALAALLAAILFATGCGLSSSGTHTVAHDHDWFTQEVDGRKVEYRNWTIAIDGKAIPIEKKKSVIRIDNAGGKVDIFVNGEQVHDE
ncbi:MAG: hypothetical protein ACI8XO_000359 [Verrucomicrobiales bacterium]|jgi:hypothetical protein